MIPGFNPWVWKILWRWEWLPPPVFLPGEFHGQGNLESYSLWDHKESDMTERLSTQQWENSWETQKKTTHEKKNQCWESAMHWGHRCQMISSKQWKLSFHSPPAPKLIKPGGFTVGRRNVQGWEVERWIMSSSPTVEVSDGSSTDWEEGRSFPFNKVWNCD